MKTFQATSLIFLIVLQSAYSQISDFKNQPWLSGYPLIIDAYGKNAMDYEKIKEDKNVGAIIYKASDGLRNDPKYTEIRKEAILNGFLAASYHLGRKGEPIKQADFYLSQIGSNTNEPMVLDIEDTEGNNISLGDAETFIKRIYEKTNKYPMVYVNNKVFNAINAKYDKSSIFAKCDLWYARFLNNLPQLSTRVWDKITLWQFASELNCQVCLERDINKKCIKSSPQYTTTCPYKIDGTKNDIDINAFNGTFEEFKTYFKK
jgi:lysozyme